MIIPINPITRLPFLDSRGNRDRDFCALPETQRAISSSSRVSECIDRSPRRPAAVRDLCRIVFWPTAVIPQIQDPFEFIYCLYIPSFYRFTSFTSTRIDIARKVFKLKVYPPMLSFSFDLSCRFISPLLLFVDADCSRSVFIFFSLRRKNKIYRKLLKKSIKLKGLWFYGVLIRGGPGTSSAM